MPPESKRTRQVRVATYNIHRGRGLDGRTKIERIASVLASVDADIVALQEVIGASPLKPGQAAELGAALGMGWVMAPTRHYRTALFGNVVLSRFPIRHHVQHDLTWKTCEHRGVQRVDLALDDDTLHFYNVHLGTSLLERRHQAVKCASFVHDRRVVGPKIVLGDFNEWARGIAKDILAERLQSIDLSKHLKRGGRSYPGFFPVLHLDHIYYEGQVEVVKVTMPRDRMTLIASDHLPLVADLKIGFD
ncbi:MAG TPA: endonuclease/exonuclease/phosphatase family protein [Vicinamibacterales bacterium]|nr:endonuclease/exonuclease/phosphatase family protein [Vicinamibacterales bacterium]